MEFPEDADVEASKEVSVPSWRPFAWVGKAK